MPHSNVFSSFYSDVCIPTEMTVVENVRSDVFFIATTGASAPKINCTVPTTIPEPFTASHPMNGDKPHPSPVKFRDKIGTISRALNLDAAVTGLGTGMSPVNSNPQHEHSSYPNPSNSLLMLYIPPVSDF